jgi:hypothetical protein
MNPALEAFLAARLPFAGLAAWGARLADHTMAKQCYVNWLTPAQVEQAMARLAMAAESLRQHQLEPVRFSWTFERMRIHLAIRPDGACLGLFVENRPDAGGTSAENILDEFAHADGL